MDIYLSILLGFIQGFTEFLPISSSGHLVVFQNFFGNGSIQDKMLEFDIILHFGSLLALGIYFYNDLKKIFFSFFQKGPFKDKKTGYFMILSVLPLVFYSIFLNTEKIEEYGNDLYLNLYGFFIMGMLFLFFEYTKSKIPEKKEIGYKELIFLSIAQVFAVFVPGFSRSGSTVGIGMFLGIEKVLVLRFSFLMGFVAIGGAMAYIIFKGIKDNQFNFLELGIINILVGLLVSFVVSFITIHYFLKIFSKISLRIFGYYMIIFPCLVFLYLFFSK